MATMLQENIIARKSAIAGFCKLIHVTFSGLSPLSFDCFLTSPNYRKSPIYYDDSYMISKRFAFGMMPEESLISPNTTFNAFYFKKLRKTILRGILRRVIEYLQLSDQKKSMYLKSVYRNLYITGEEQRLIADTITIR